MSAEHITAVNESDILNKSFELSHIIGLNLTSGLSVQCHPSMQETIIYSVGGIIIAEDLTEKNNQVFFRHSRYQVNCFKISNTGRYLAVGFTTGEENYDKKLIANIILWDYEKKSIIYELNEIYKAVTHLEFSQDDKFLSAAGLDNSFFTWEVASGYKCFNRVYEYPISFIYWTTMSRSQDTLSNKSSTRLDYTITVANNSTLFYLYFYFELKSMQYNVKYGKFTLPSTGFVRNYTSGFYDELFNSLYLGTSGGELILFSLDNLFFKSSFNVINNGVTCLVFLPESEEIIVSGGDGKIKKISRTMLDPNSRDLLKLQHVMTYETVLPGKINSMSLIADRKEIVCVSSEGKVFRLLTSNLNYTLHSTAHSASVNDIAFNNISKVNDLCYTVDDNGNLYQFDLNDFNVLGFIPANDDVNANSVQIPKATSVFIGDDESIFIGYSSGSLKNFTSDLQVKLFDIPTHRGNVTCIYVDGNYILTGGEDGIVRVWTRKNHELIIQIPAHHRNVTKVIADINKPNLIYSCGEDRELICFDLKLQKRMTTQSIKNGNLCGIAQRIDGDNEIISVGVNCNLFVWDFYKTDPVNELNLNNEKFYDVKISHNGKYFALGSIKGELWLFTLPKYEFIGKSQGHSGKVNQLQWSPDDKQIISISADSSICVWNVYSGNE